MDPATTQAVAKAAEETAKTAGKALDIAHDTGGYLGRVVGDLPANVVGVLGADWLREQRFRNIDRMKRRTAKILRERDVIQAIELSPNQATELLTAAQDESREALAELWARLLANAMDPNLNNVRRSFIDAVKNMDPVDAFVLEFIFDRNFHVVQRLDDPKPNGATSIDEISRVIHCGADGVEVSLRHLETLGFFNDQGNWANLNLYVNANFREFMRACYPEVQRGR